jgi:hypothetical protein
VSGVTTGAGVVLDAVDAVGVGRQACTPGSPCSAMAQPSRNSVARPPRPPLRTVTVVSPPDRITQGAAKGWPRRATARASAACTLPTSRLSPSISSLRMWAPGQRRARAAAAASRLAAAWRSGATAWPAKRGSPGLGVSKAPLSSPASAAAGSSMP